MKKKLILLILPVIFSLACFMEGMSSQLPEPAETITAAPVETPPFPMPTGTSTPQGCIVTADHLNLRSGPGTAWGSIAILNNGETVTIHTTEPAQASWIFVTARGLDGWINQKFCKRNGEIQP